MNKNILLSTLVALGFAMVGLTTVVAAESESTDESAHQIKHGQWLAENEELLAKFERYRTELNLSETQQEKVKVINSRYFEGLASLQTSGGTRFSKLRTFRSLSNKRDQEMEQVLDKQQYKRYKEMQQEMRRDYRSQ